VDDVLGVLQGVDGMNQFRPEFTENVLFFFVAKTFPFSWDHRGNKDPDRCGLSLWANSKTLI
jgi:hypothetical protein